MFIMILEFIQQFVVKQSSWRREQVNTCSKGLNNFWASSFVTGCVLLVLLSLVHHKLFSNVILLMSQLGSLASFEYTGLNAGGQEYISHRGE